MNKTKKISPKSHVEAVDDKSRQSGSITDEQARELLDYLDNAETVWPQEDLLSKYKMKRVSLKR